MTHLTSLNDYAAVYFVYRALTCRRTGMVSTAPFPFLQVLFAIWLASRRTLRMSQLCHGRSSQQPPCSGGLRDNYHSCEPDVRFTWPDAALWSLPVPAADKSRVYMPEARQHVSAGAGPRSHVPSDRMWIPWGGDQRNYWMLLGILLKVKLFAGQIYLYQSIKEE